MLSASTRKTLLPGRRQESERLAAWLTRVASGAGGALVFHGDKGIGKTALVRFAATEAAGFAVSAISGHEAETAIPFAGLHQVLDPLAEHLSARLSGQAQRLVRALTEEADGGLALPVRVLRLFREAARERPLLCTVDDAQWLDEPSLAVLTFVARRLREDRVGMLFAYCDEEWDSGCLSGIAAHRLAPLDREACGEILRSIVPVATLVPTLVDVAQGNPRALMELVGSLAPGQLRGDEPAPRTLPPDSGLRRAYRARLDRLPHDTRWLVLLAAADDHVDADTLVRAAVGSGVDIGALEPAETAGLVGVDGARVIFPRALVRSVAYHEATLAQRRAAHQCLAQVLDPSTLRHVLHRAEAADGPDDQLAAELERAVTESTCGYADCSRALARAADLTSDGAVAAARLVTAARYAWHAGEPVRAWAILHQARTTKMPVDVRARSTVLAGEIELRTGRASTARRTFLAAADVATRDRYVVLAALMRAGEALCLAGGYPRYPDIAGKALALRRPHETLGAQSMFDHFTALSATFRGDHGQAIGPARRLFTFASTLDDVDTLTRTGMAALFRGNEAQAYQLATRAVRVARADGDKSALPPAMEVVTLAEFLLGGYDDTATGLAGLRLARESGQDTLADNYLALLAMFAAVTGDRHACVARLRSFRPTGPRFSRAGAFRIWALALLDLADGRYADAVRRLRELMIDSNGSGHLVVQVTATPHLVEAAVRGDRRAMAVNAFKVYDSWAASTGNPHWLALSARCQALLAGNADEAEEHFRAAMERHASTPNEFDLARTGLLFGQHLRRRRKPKLAREYLSSALSTFERFDARPWAERAAAELRAAGHPTRPTVAPVTETLTPHQVQIARLVAEGATNREVAARMLISTRTVDHHMRNIFAKLGVRSRVELAKLMR